MVHIGCIIKSQAPILWQNVIRHEMSSIQVHFSKLYFIVHFHESNIGFEKLCTNLCQSLTSLRSIFFIEWGVLFVRSSMWSTLTTILGLIGHFTNMYWVNSIDLKFSFKHQTKTQQFVDWIYKVNRTKCTSFGIEKNWQNFTKD